MKIVDENSELLGHGLQDISLKIAEILDIQSRNLILKSIRRGCIEIVYLVPDDVIEANQHLLEKIVHSERGVSYRLKLSQCDDLKQVIIVLVLIA